MKRQRGRNRGGGGGGGGGGKPQHNANRAFDSNGPDNVKIRGHAQHVFEKYQQLARDAFSSGDRVLAENYLQHADHYFRVLRTIQPQRSPSEILGRDVLASGLDIDFEEEFEPAEENGADATLEGGAETAGETGRNDGRGLREDRYERGEGRRDSYDYREPRRDDRYETRRDNDGQSREAQSREGQSREAQSREGQSREGQSREGQSRESREGQSRDGYYRETPFRDGAPRDTGLRDGQPRDAQVRDAANRDRNDRYDRGERQDRGGERQDRGERQGPDRSEGRRDNRRFEGRDRAFGRDGREPRYDDRRPAEPAAGDPLAVVAPTASAPFPAPEAEASPVLRSQDGGMSEAPAFLQAGAGEDGEVRKPRARRRRAPKSFEAGEGEPSGPAVEEV